MQLDQYLPVLLFILVGIAVGILPQVLGYGVLEQTLARCQTLRLRRAMLETRRDIDRPADLDWLAEALRSRRLESPRVAEWLRERDASGPRRGGLHSPRPT